MQVGLQPTAEVPLLRRAEHSLEGDSPWARLTLRAALWQLEAAQGPLEVARDHLRWRLPSGSAEDHLRWHKTT